MRYIVTGATGFIGSNIVKRLLKEGHDISILIRKSSSLELLEDIRDNIKIFVYDGKIESIIEFFKEFKADIVLHLASLFIAEHNSSNVDTLIDSNVKFSTQILEAMKEANIERLINTGTSWQHYENEDYNPVCLYAATKEAYEKIIEYYVQSYEFKCITLELFDSYGPKDNRPKLLNLLNKFSEEKKVLSLSPGEQILDLVHIQDIVNGYEIASKMILERNEKCNDKYVLSSQNRIKLRELIYLYEKVTGKKVLVNWGKREYRKREVMIPWDNGLKLPNWEAKINLEEGLKEVFISK